MRRWRAIAVRSPPICVTRLSRRSSTACCLFSSIPQVARAATRSWAWPATATGDVSASSAARSLTKSGRLEGCSLTSLLSNAALRHGKSRTTASITRSSSVPASSSRARALRCSAIRVSSRSSGSVLARSVWALTISAYHASRSSSDRCGCACPQPTRIQHAATSATGRRHRKATAITGDSVGRSASQVKRSSQPYHRAAEQGPPVAPGRKPPTMEAELGRRNRVARCNIGHFGRG